MALTQRLEIRQSHALVMTPQLMQAIKLLQLSNLDLAAYVEGELERNPLLERAVETDGPNGEREPNGGDLAVDGDPGADLSQAAGDSRAGDWMGQELETSRGAIEDRLGTGLENVFPDDANRGPAEASPDVPGYSDWARAGGGPRPDGDYNLEAFVSAETTLADQLAEDISLAVADPASRMIGQYLIDMVDEAGYLVGDLTSVAEKLGAPLVQVEAVLALLQSFDPAGVCARNLTECLAAQLKERDRYDPAMQ